MTFEQTQVSIRTKIKQYSEEKKITSQKLADRAGVSYNSIVKWKAGKEAFNPTVKNLIGLANAMGVTVAELIGES
jgi:Helix-turn-helix.